MSNLGAVYQVEVNMKSFINNTYIKNKFPVVYNNSEYYYGKQGENKKLKEFCKHDLRTLDEFKQEILRKKEFKGFIYIKEKVSNDWIKKSYENLNVNFKLISLQDLQDKLEKAEKMKKIFENSIKQYELLIEADKRTLERHKNKLYATLNEIGFLKKEIDKLKEY